MAEVFTVHHGLTYRAELQLSFFESMASNDMVAEKFHELGFRHITVSGEGDQRWAQGTWDGPDESVPLTDEHVISVVEVKAPKAAMKAPSVYRRDIVEGGDQDEPVPAIDPYPGTPEAPSEEVQPGENTGIVPPYLRKKIEDEKLGTPGDKPGDYHGGPKSGQGYNPFNPAYPDANANNNVG